MSDSLESLRRKKHSAAELASVVRTMKAMAASNISQYEMAVQALIDYYRSISLGIKACLLNQPITGWVGDPSNKNKPISVAVIFGSDQGLVGNFNEVIALFAAKTLQSLPGRQEIWAVGERVNSRLDDAGLRPRQQFNVPNSVTAITPLVNDIIIQSEQYREKNQSYSLYIFHNRPVPGIGYQQHMQRLLPLDLDWVKPITTLQWPTKNIPQVIGNPSATLGSLINEYLFVSIYKACAESLSSENESRLEAMQRAEKNIGELLEALSQSYNRLRQSTIDEELFDVVAGFEALKNR